MKKVVKKILKSLGLQLIGETQIKRNDVFFHLKKILNKEEAYVIFDVGAATGDFSADMKKLFSASDIYAFEPQSALFNHIQKQYGDICRAYDIGFSDIKGEHEFFITKNGYSSSLIRPAITKTDFDEIIKVDSSVTINTDTIDHFCDVNNIGHINLLKLDIQGAELAALKGAGQMLEKGLIDVIYAEVEFIQFYEKQPLYHDIALYLEKFNYQLYNIYNQVYLKHSAILWADVIFIRKGLYEKLLNTE